jgi:hypothetical protein
MTTAATDIFTNQATTFQNAINAILAECNAFSTG